MKTIDRIPFLSNVLIVACTRMNNSEVGKLVKAVVAYATDGTRPAMDDLRLETYFDLIAQDLVSLRTAAEVKSRKCSESAKCRTAKTTARPANVSKRAIDNPPASTANDSEEKSETDFNANDPTSSFERMKQIYGKTGNNESQAFDTWKLLTADERTTAFANVQRLHKTGVPQGGLQQ